MYECERISSKIQKPWKTTTAKICFFLQKTTAFDKFITFYSYVINRRTIF